MKIRVFWVAVIAVGLMFAAGVGLRIDTYGRISALYSAFSLFFSINLLICYWEICLYLRRDYIEKRLGYWQDRQRETGRSPAFEFLTTRIPVTQVFSPTVWADAWATYSIYDSAYTDRRTYGFNVDVANGFATLVPTLILYAALTIEFLPAVVTGVIGLALCWQWIYMTSIYIASVFIAKRHLSMTRSELTIWVLAPNGPWILGPLLGLYVFVRLIIDGDYQVMPF